MSNFKLTQKGSFWVGEFRAMASPCEVMVDTTSRNVAHKLVSIAANEALRVEKTFSRYRDDNVICQLNNANGKAVTVDEETAELIDFSAQCHAMSDGMFDITSGVLRRAWTFNESNTIPEQSLIDTLLPLVGWHKVQWQRPVLTMPTNMQIDFGGIGKEYAVDRAVNLIRQAAKCAVLVNFGGDIHASAAPSNGNAWRIGIEHVKQQKQSVQSIDLYRGALTTSGDTYRFIQHKGIRYGHVLDPRTGWPAPHAPHSVTVASNSCTEAGVLSTLAMLNGENAERFLNEEEVKYWCQR